MKGSGRPVRQHTRPSIDLSEPEVKREWRTISVADVKDGDTVVDVGVVAARGQRLNRVRGDVVARILVNIHDEQKEYAPDAEVLAFVRVSG